MELLIQLDAEQERLFAAQGDIQAYLNQLIAREALRLWHIERSRPKPREDRPAGPRRLTPQEREVRETGNFLRGIYLKLKEQFGPEYAQHFGEQEAELETAIAANDITTLLRFKQEQPWLKR